MVQFDRIDALIEEMGNDVTKPREILAAAVSVDPVLGWLDDSAELRAAHGGLDLPTPERSPAREVYLG